MNSYPAGESARSWYHEFVLILVVPVSVQKRDPLVLPAPITEMRMAAAS